MRYIRSLEDVNTYLELQQNDDAVVEEMLTDFIKNIYMCFADPDPILEAIMPNFSSAVKRYRSGGMLFSTLEIFDESVSIDISRIKEEVLRKYEAEFNLP